MKFQLIYYKKGSNNQTIETKDFASLNAVKRWYKKGFYNGEFEFPFFRGWDLENDKPFHYSIRNYIRNRVLRK